MGDAVVREPVEVGVAAGVVGLADVADYAGYGGEEDEEIEVCGEGFVQVPCALDFGLDYGLEIGEGHGGEGAVLVGVLMIGHGGWSNVRKCTLTFETMVA